MYYFILNPVAGRSRLASIQSKLKKKLQSLNLIGEFMKTSGEGDAENLARLAVKKGYSTIICVGGDTTVNDVLNGISGTDTALGIIPIGDENLFARRIGIPEDYLKAVDIISARFVENFDSGRLLERRESFLMACGLGAEVDLCLKKMSNGFSLDTFLNQKPKVLANEFGNFVGAEMRFIIDKSYAIETKVLSASIINSCFIKEGYLDNYPFEYSDGLLDLIIIPADIPHNKLVALMKSKNHKSFTEVTHLRAREIHVESLHDQMKVHVDGRIIAKTPVTFTISPAKQKIIVNRNKKIILDSSNPIL